MVQAKQPTVTLCQLMADFYAKRLFQQGETLISSTFPELQIQASAIFAAGEL
jgi:Uma2 family endonuclease